MYQNIDSVMFKWLPVNAFTVDTLKFNSITLIERGILKEKTIGISRKIFKSENTLIKEYVDTKFDFNIQYLDMCTLSAEISFYPIDHPYDMPVNMYISTINQLEYYVLDLNASPGIKERKLGTYPFPIFNLIGRKIKISWITAHGKPSTETIPISNMTMIEVCDNDKVRNATNFIPKRWSMVDGQKVAMFSDDTPVIFFAENVINNDDSNDDIDWRENFPSSGFNLNLPPSTVVIYFVFHYFLGIFF